MKSGTRRAAALVALAAGLFPAFVSGQETDSAAAAWAHAEDARVAGRWETAAERYEVFLRLRPDHVRARVRAGECRLEAGDAEAADRDFAAALARDPDDPGALAGRGRAALALGRPADAEPWLHRALAADPDLQRALLLEALGCSLQGQGRHAEAETAFQSALQRHGREHSPSLYSNALLNRLARGDAPGAVELGRRGTARFPEEPWIWQNHAWALEVAGVREAAGQAFARAEALLPTPPEPTHTIPLALPFAGRWTVLQGNHGTESHRGLLARFAWDFQAIDEAGQTFRGDGSRNEDFASFGRDILAAAAGMVVAAFDGIPDHPPGRPDSAHPRGNHVCVRHAPGEFTLYFHLQERSVAVTVGQSIPAGALVGRCGNSGWSGQPHLHFALAEGGDPDSPVRPAALGPYRRIGSGVADRVERGVPGPGERLEPDR